jgi:hypothetical protein
MDKPLLTVVKSLNSQKAKYVVIGGSRLEDRAATLTFAKPLFDHLAMDAEFDRKWRSEI